MLCKASPTNWKKGEDKVIELDDKQLWFQCLFISQSLNISLNFCFLYPQYQSLTAPEISCNTWPQRRTESIFLPLISSLSHFSESTDHRKCFLKLCLGIISIVQRGTNQHGANITWSFLEKNSQGKKITGHSPQTLTSVQQWLGIGILLSEVLIERFA